MPVKLLVMPEGRRVHVTPSEEVIILPPSPTTANCVPDQTAPFKELAIDLVVQFIDTGTALLLTLLHPAVNTMQKEKRQTKYPPLRFDAICHPFFRGCYSMVSYSDFIISRLFKVRDNNAYGQRIADGPKMHYTCR
jgi:hypothetical protein